MKHLVDVIVEGSIDRVKVDAVLEVEQTGESYIIVSDMKALQVAIDASCEQSEFPDLYLYCWETGNEYWLYYGLDGFQGISGEWVYPVTDDYDAEAVAEIVEDLDEISEEAWGDMLYHQMMEESL